MLAFLPLDACSVLSKSCSFILRSLAREIPVRRSSSARLILSRENSSPCSAIICSMTSATAGSMAGKLGFFIWSPFTEGWLCPQCKGLIQFVNGVFRLTRIGVFRLTRNGDYRLTLTVRNDMAIQRVSSLRLYGVAVLFSGPGMRFVHQIEWKHICGKETHFAPAQFQSWRCIFGIDRKWSSFQCRCRQYLRVW